MTACQRSLPRSPRSNKYSQEYAGRVVSRQSGTRRRSVIRLFHGVARYNQVFHAIDSLTSLSLSSHSRRESILSLFIIIISSRFVPLETILNEIETIAIQCAKLRRSDKHARSRQLHGSSRGNTMSNARRLNFRGQGGFNARCWQGWRAPLGRINNFHAAVNWNYGDINLSSWIRVFVSSGNSTVYSRGRDATGSIHRRLAPRPENRLQVRYPSALVMQFIGRFI